MVQLTDELVRQLDERAAADGVSRSQLIREAVVAYLGDDEHVRAVRAFTDAYAVQPDDADELAAATRNAREMVADEQW